MSSSDDMELPFDRPDDTSDASPIFGAIMVLWFSGLGVGGGYLAVTKYLAGVPPTEPSVLAPIGGMVAMLGAAGAVASTVTWRSPTLPENAPWKVRPAWQSPTIEEDLYFRTVSPWSAAFINVVSWGLAAPILYFNYWLPENPDSAFLFVLIFPAAGLAAAALVLRRVWHRRRYGLSTLTMDSMPGRLGRPLVAHLRADLDPSNMHGDAFHTRLICYHRSKSDDDSSWLTKWEAETDVRAYTSSNSQSGVSADSGVEVPISFDLPTDAPPSTPEKKSDRIAWILEVSAEMNGLDYQAFFEIPVFEPEEAGEPASEQAREASSPELHSTQESTSGTDPALETPIPPEGPSSTEESSSTDDPAPPRTPGSPDAPPSPEEPEPEPSVPEPEPSSAEASDDSYDDLFEDTANRDQANDADTVRCDNCRSTVAASASTCPACGADLDSDWFS